MLAVYLLACLAGLIVLARASDALVVGSSALAYRLGVPTLVVGVVIIGFGTSAPELLVCGLAAAGGSPAIGVGTVIGSNIANLSLVLGAGAIVAPLAVRAAVVRREAPLSLLATMAFAGAVWAGLTRAWGLVLLAFLAVALTLMVRWALADRAEAGNGSRALREEVTGVVTAGDSRSAPVVTLQAFAGLVGTLLGGEETDDVELQAADDVDRVASVGGHRSGVDDEAEAFAGELRSAVGREAFEADLDCGCAGGRTGKKGQDQCEPPQAAAHHQPTSSSSSRRVASRFDHGVT